MKRRYKFDARRLIIYAVVFLIVFLVDYVKDSKSKKVSSSSGSDDYVTFFDVGQGDCSVISSNGKNFLIDTGDGEDNSVSLVRSLKNKGIKNIDVLSISHYHEDHTGGLDDILSAFDVAEFIFPPKFSDTRLANEIVLAKETAKQNQTEILTPSIGHKMKLGDFNVTCIYTPGKAQGENNRSVYFMAEIEGIKFLFTGDGEASEEKKVIKKNTSIKCDVLKVPHHGGSGSSSDRFLKECLPSYAVISCKTGNMYGHPHRETLERLNGIGCNILRTDQSGDVTFNVVDGELSIETEK